jgi:hypothetical protein
MSPPGRRIATLPAVDSIPYRACSPDVESQVEYTDEFGTWWDTLTEDERIRVTASVALLQRRGPGLPFPHSSGVSGSRHGRMRELRVQVGRRPIRIFYAFDPRLRWIPRMRSIPVWVRSPRVAILLIGGDKTGRDGFYVRLIPIADRLYDQHLAQIAAAAARGGRIDDG